MQKHILLLILTFLVYNAHGQNRPARINIEVADGVNPWNHLSLNNGAEKFQFAIVTDRTGGLRPGIFASAIPKLNLLQPEFVMSVGDLISGYTEDEARIDREWEEFDGFIKQLKMPFFYVPGNHDYINDVMAKKWKERLGKDYYHFTYKDVLFMCLNTEELKRGAGKGYIDDPQYTYIEKTLKENPDVKWTLIFMHQPLWDQDDSGRWEDVEKLLENRKHTVFVGHRHRYVKYERNNGKYFILATTGGGSGLRGANFGEFDHVVWVTMTDEGPILANLMLEGIWDENVNTEERYTFTRPLMNKKAWEVSPMFVEGETFSGEKLSIKISNDSDVPMTAKGNFTSSKDLWVQSSAFDLEVSPNSVEMLTLPLLTRDNEALSQVDPVSMDIKVIYQPDNQPEFAVTSSEKISPIFTQKLKPSKKKINIDGKNTEWGKLSYLTDVDSYTESTPFTHKGNADCQIQFDLAYDKSFLYVYAEVIDNQVESDGSFSVMDQDALFVVLDARPKEQSILNTGRGLFRGEFAFIGASPGTKEPVYHYPEIYPKEAQVKCAKTKNGYALELAIPVSYLDEKAGGDWKNLRLNVFAVDRDHKGEHISQVWWQPDWRNKANMVGSGLFER